MPALFSPRERASSDERHGEAGTESRADTKLDAALATISLIFSFLNFINDVTFMTVRRRVHQLPAHPLTASAANLTSWLDMPPKRRQAELASACSVSQQTISDYKRRAARPDPGSELALLIEVATGGFVRAAGWLTTEELRLRRKNQKRAASFAKLEARHSTPPTPGSRRPSRRRAVATRSPSDDSEAALGERGS